MLRRAWRGAALITLCVAVAACVGTIDPAEEVGQTPPSDGGVVGVDAPAVGTPDASWDSAVGADAADSLYASLDPAVQQLFDIINAERVAAGAGVVTLSENLICAAARHSDDVGPAGSCSHTGTDGSDPGSRVVACGGGAWSGEIIACGQSTPRAAVDAWLGSPGHNAIMLDPGQRTIGVAMNNNYWTAIFNR